MRKQVLFLRLVTSVRILVPFLPLLLTCAAHVAIAAEFRVRTMPPLVYSAYVNTQGACQFEMVGVIADGDAQAFRVFLEGKDLGQLPVVLCLNSPGGSLGQAVEIAEVVMAQKIGTSVENGAKCVSSCAFVFMAGSAPDLTISENPKSFALLPVNWIVFG